MFKMGEFMGFRALAAAPFISALFLSSAAVEAAPSLEFDRQAAPTKAQIDACRNANTLLFQRASIFTQTSSGTILPNDGGSGVYASIHSAEAGRHATASLNRACAANPDFRIENPAMEGQRYLGVRPNLNTPRAIPKAFKE